MTEDQKSMSIILELLGASKEIPRAWQWIRDELKLEGRATADVPALLEAMEAAGLVSWKKDGLGVKRWVITKEGMAAR